MELNLHSLAALKPSQFREFMRSGWNKKRLNPVFSKFGEERGYRIYIPFGDMSVPDKLVPPAEVTTYLRSVGVTVEDYAKGIGKDKHGRLVRLGKVLKRRPQLKNDFDNDIRRTGNTLKNMVVVISRHPYDIAGMSTDRSWTSCMNLDGGTYKAKVTDEIKVGTLVAYLIKNDDTNINRPLARCLIKPFKSGRKTYYGVEKSYPEGYTQVRKFLTLWVDKNINKAKSPSIAQLNPESYADGMEEIAVGYDTIEGRKLLNTDSNYASAAISQDPSVIEHISDGMLPSVILSALYGGITASELDSAMGDRYLILDYMDREAIVRRFPQLLPKCFPKDALNDDTLLELVKADSNIVRYMAESIENFDFRLRTPLISKIAFFIDTDDNVSYLIDKYSKYIDPNLIFSMSGVPKNKTLYKKIGVTEDPKLALFGIRKAGLAIFNLNPDHLGELFDFTDQDTLDRVADAVDDYLTTMIKSSFGQGMNTVFPYRMIFDYQKLFLYLYEYYNFDAVACLTASTSPLPYIRNASTIISLFEECKSIDDPEEVYKAIRIPELTHVQGFAYTKLYPAIGFEHTYKSPNWIRFLGKHLAEGIMKNSPVPSFFKEPNAIFPKYKAEEICDYLNDNTNDSNLVPDRWMPILATRGCTKYAYVAKYLFDNQHLIDSINITNINMWEILDDVRSLIRSESYPDLSITLAEYTAFENAFRENKGIF